jgi:hypothetical protein
MLRTLISTLFALSLVIATTTQAAPLTAAPQAQKYDLLYPVALALGVVAGVAAANYFMYGTCMGTIPAVTGMAGAPVAAGAGAAAPTASAAASTLPMSLATSRVLTVASGALGALVADLLYPW